jgi:hypothetical protein
MYHADGMKQVEWDKAMRELYDQELALFARRAHRQLGRGFVLSDVDELQPVYVTWMIGVPTLLLDAVFEYDPECEAVIVSEDEEEEGNIIINCVRIQSCH